MQRGRTDEERPTRIGSAVPAADERVAPRVGRVLAAGSVITVGFMGSVIGTPLYQAKFGFCEITLTLVYAVYAVGNVAALLGVRPDLGSTRA